MAEVPPANQKYVVVGGAGFIGSHLVEYLLNFDEVEVVKVVDNFSSGTRSHLGKVSNDPRLEVFEFDLSTDEGLEDLIDPDSTVVHLASNPDIAAAASDPTIDFYQGTALSNAVAEAARIAKVRQVLYASGSGVYGDYGDQELSEDSVQLNPISTYGASKLAGEALFCAYAHMFDVPAIAFRFGNVVGPKQTHGVGYDFIRRLLDNPLALSVLGDGQQSKTYVHVRDVIRAVLIAESQFSGKFGVFNVGTDEYITVKEIAALAIDTLGIEAPVDINYSGGDRGWKGDVPVLRLSTRKIRGLGWRPDFSTPAAISDSLQSMLSELVTAHGNETFEIGNN